MGKLPSRHLTTSLGRTNIDLISHDQNAVLDNKEQLNNPPESYSQRETKSERMRDIRYPKIDTLQAPRVRKIPKDMSKVM